MIPMIGVGVFALGMVTMTFWYVRQENAAKRRQLRPTSSQHTVSAH